ncbi:MAG: DUF1579 domain-containing protein [bacterium]|nr:DUF1579 domain-containing protein [bacterium]
MKRLMKRRWGWAYLACAMLLVVPVLAHEKGDGGQKGDDEAAAAMMEMMKYAMPGDHHRHLDSLEGNWRASSKFRMGPEAPWSESGGRCAIEWILGGRFLQQKITAPPSEQMPMEFEGFGLLGYDNYAQKHIGLWMDNFFTGMIAYDGGCDATGKVITPHAEFPHPAKGGALTKVQWIYRIVNDDRFEVEIWEPDEQSKNYLHGQITYTRTQ